MFHHVHSRPSTPCAAPSPLAPLVRHLLSAGLLLAGGGVIAQTSPANTGSTALPSITVTGKAIESLAEPYAGGQVSTGGTLGFLGTMDTMDTPFSTINYTEELLQNQQARTLADVVVNDASVRLTTGSGGFEDPFQIRGFAVGSGDVGFNGIYGLISSSRVPAQLLERVEVLKGPGTFINGIPPGGSVGGSINVISKRAGDVPLTRVTTTYQSKANVGLQLDMGRRFGDDNQWGIRFNGQVRGGEATIRGGSQDGRLGALALDYRGKKVRWTLDVVQQEDDTDEFRPQITIATTTTIPEPADARTNFYPGTQLRQKDTTVATRVEYDVNDAITTYAGFGKRSGTNFQTFPQTNSTGTGANGVNAAGVFSASNSYYDSYSETTTGNAGARLRFKTGSVGHTVTAGVTSLKQETGFGYSAQPGSNLSSIYNPAPLPAITVPRLTATKNAVSTLESFALADTLSFANDTLLVTLGLRDQSVQQEAYNQTTGALTTNYKANSVTPLAGIVFKPAANISVYGNYTAGLTRGTIVGQTFSNRGEVLAPFKSEQYEAGVKVDFGSVTTTAAVYEISRPSLVGTAPGAQSYGGEQRNRGLELSAFGEIKRGLRAMASVAFVDAKLVKTNNGVNQGKTPAGVPNSTLSAGLDWDTPWVQGLSLNGRVIHTAGAYLTDANTLRFDSWQRYDIGARYATKVAGKPVVLRGAIENVFDKNYWLTAGTYVGVGSPRTVVLSASVDF